MAKLLLRQTDGDQLLAELDTTQTYSIGRAEDCAICIPAEAVSSLHAQLAFSEQGWLIEDLDSANGTTVNNETIEATLLPDGSEITLGGQVSLLFQAETAGGAPAAEAAEAPEPERGRGKKGLKLQSASNEDLKLVKAMSLRSERVRAEIAKVIIGQVEVIDQVMMVIIAGGHGLLVGMPGMAKTTLCATIAKVLDMEFKRVQFTPDLMPTDITGTEILEHDPVTDKKSFRFIKGPIFTNMLLADEINRTPPKTQASLLEAMQEKCVTVGNETYRLDAPFFVLATQNPIEQEGTYPLPEAQQDRFMFNLWVDYPLADEEETIVKATTVAQSEEPQKVISKEELLQLQAVVRKIPVSDHVIKIRRASGARHAPRRRPEP